jgi:hypothetical protein
MTIVSSIFLILFVVWGIISIVSQFRDNFVDRLRNWDFCGLIPTWTFFAPNPVSSDNFLYYREHNANGTTEWRRAFISPDIGIVFLVWNPYRREEKAITDCMFQLLDFSTKFDKERLHLSISYLTILNYVTSLQHSTDSMATQFLFGTKKMNEQLKPIFMSNSHKI